MFCSVYGVTSSSSLNHMSFIVNSRHNNNSNHAKIHQKCIFFLRCDPVCVSSGFYYRAGDKLGVVFIAFNYNTNLGYGIPVDDVFRYG